MSRLQAIENALSSINSATFQELCDSFLALRNSNYSAFSRTGSQTGKQKTVKGTPDTFLLLPSGKFIFVEYSTNVSAGLQKLKDDIRKCIDATKTGVSVDQIAEIIICVNFNLTTSVLQSLWDLLANTRIALTIYTLDALAIELHLNHRDLAHEYLGLPFDTGQIVSIERFIEEYNKASKGISTPLDNTFVHRKKELKELKEAILHNNFVIITGPPGVGKSKLAIEGIKNFLKEHLSFQAYCVSYKHHTLLDDLYQYFDSEKDYILFVDDANRIDAFGQITGFYKASRRGRLKVVITVRDYAYQDIGILCQEFQPMRLDLSKLSDEEIIDIIKAFPFEILNPDYHKEIIRIADGNPRLAIMTALLAKAYQNIYALADVSGLFENYFSTFIRDDGEFARLINIRCLGLISFFYTIPYKNREITTSILDNFGIDYATFIDVIDQLDKLELVEIQFEHVKIPEQNLSTYFFYKAFIKDDLLSFQTLLSKYFDNNIRRFKDCVIPANNTFGVKKVMDKIQPFLKNHLQLIKSDDERTFKFLSTFWYYLSGETFEFVYHLVEALPIVIQAEYKVTYENNAFSYEKDNIIELLGEFFRFSNYLKDALQLAFEYTKKKPEHLPELIHKIREHLTFDSDDSRNGFLRQTTLFETLIKGIQDQEILYVKAFYELSKTFLSFTFRQTKSGRKMSIIFYEYPIPNVKVIHEFRSKIWSTIDYNFVNYPDESFDLLNSYASRRPDVSKAIMEYDIPFIVDIIENHLTASSFLHCKYVHELIRWCNSNSVHHSSFKFLSEKYTNSTYEIYLKIDWDRLRDKEIYDFKDYREYEKLKEAEIRSSFVFNSEYELKKFYNIFVYLKRTTKNDWNYNTTLDYVLDENFVQNFNLGCCLLGKVVEMGNEVNYVPRLVFKNHLNQDTKAKFIWQLIHKKDFNYKELWELSFYDYLEDSLISKEYVESLLRTIGSMKDRNTIHFESLKRFLSIQPNLFHLILETIVEKNEKEGTRVQLWMDFFDNYFDELRDDIQLIKKAYIQQDQIQNHFDYEGKGFLKILKIDPKFLVEYVDSLFSVKQFGLSADDRNLSFVWQLENIEEEVEAVFNLVIEKEPYFGILDHFCNSFFRGLNEKDKETAKDFLFQYCKSSYTDFHKMNVVIDIVRNSLPELFEETLLLFLSLNPDKEIFSKIWWRGNGGSYSGDVIIGDIEAADWRNILSIVEKSDMGVKLIPIKKYINEKIENSLKSGDWERQRRFLERY
jgi:hypothetical protein